MYFYHGLLSFKSLRIAMFNILISIIQTCMIKFERSLTSLYFPNIKSPGKGVNDSLSKFCCTSQILF